MQISISFIFLVIEEKKECKNEVIEINIYSLYYIYIYISTYTHTLIFTRLAEPVTSS